MRTDGSGTSATGQARAHRPTRAIKDRQSARRFASLVCIAATRSECLVWSS